MGSNKKHKLKKHKGHSREIKEETDGFGAGKMKLIFRVPPPQPSSPLQSDSSLVVSLPLEEIVRARHSSLEESNSTSTKLTKKRKKKHHQKPPALLTPPTLLNSSTSERDDDEIEIGGGKRHHSSQPYGSGKDMNFHKMSGKERSYHHRVQAGPFLEADEDEESDAEMDKDTSMEMETEISSLPVEINLNMLSIGSKKRPRNGGKDMRMTKISKTPSVNKDVTPPRIIQTPPIVSPLLVSSSPTKTPPANPLGHYVPSDEGEKKKKKKKKHKHHHIERSPLKVKKLSEPSMSSPEIITPSTTSSVSGTNDSQSKVISPIIPKQQKQQQQKQQQKQQKQQQQDMSLSSDVIMQEPQQDISEAAQLLRQTLSPADTSFSIPSPASSSSSRLQGVKLPVSALRYFLKHLHNQITRNDPDGVFSEPVTDDIAPGYSNIIKQSMDLQTMAVKIDSNSYSTVDEFKDDFVLMCNNAMTYNTPETQYYLFSKQLLNFGLKLIQKEMSVRPDIRHGLIPTIVASPSPSQAPIDYSSPFLCKLDLSSLKPSSSSSRGGTPHAGGTPQAGGTESVDDNYVIDVSDEIIKEHVDQTHLTQVQVGLDKEEETPLLSMFQQSDKEMSEEEILQQVDQAYINMKENTDTNTPQPELSFLSEEECGKTTLHILNPDSVPPCPVNLNTLADKIKAGENASTVLTTELPIFKATPVSYLMYGPFGSFAPTYDTSFANLTKHDSSLLLSTYGNELGVNYANSLNQFVKGCGNFAMEMADAILNSLTNGRHMKFVESLKKEDEKPSQEKVKPPLVDKEKESDVPPPLNELQDEVMSETVEETEPETEVTDATDELMGEDSLEDGPVNVEESLSQTSKLLIKLETEQNERLSQSPHLSSQTGDYILPNPTETELDTASEVSTELVSLTAKVTPSDVSTVSSLHRAMGTDHLTTHTPTSTTP